MSTILPMMISVAPYVAIGVAVSMALSCIGLRAAKKRRAENRLWAEEQAAKTATNEYRALWAA